MPKKQFRELITVVMPVRNGQDFVGQSVTSVISQTYTNWELIVIDDASSDGTASIVKEFCDPRISYVRNLTHQGVSKSLNRGLALANGSFIARLDADDFSRSDRFEKQIAKLLKSPTLGLIGSWVNTFGLQNKILKFPTTDSQLRLALCFSNPFAHSSVIFRARDNKNRRWLYKDCPAQDYELWIRISQHFQIANIPEALTSYRKHSGQVTVRFSASYPQYVRGFQAEARRTFLSFQDKDELAISTQPLFSKFLLAASRIKNGPSKAFLILMVAGYVLSKIREKIGLVRRFFRGS